MFDPPSVELDIREGFGFQCGGWFQYGVYGGVVRLVLWRGILPLTLPPLAALVTIVHAPLTPPSQLSLQYRYSLPGRIRVRIRDPPPLLLS